MKDYIEIPKIKEFIMEDFMEPLGLSVKEVASAIDVPEAFFRDILEAKCPIDAQLSSRLGQYFEVSEQYFLKLQADINRRLTKRLNRENFKFTNITFSSINNSYDVPLTLDSKPLDKQQNILESYNIELEENENLTVDFVDSNHNLSEVA